MKTSENSTVSALRAESVVRRSSRIASRVIDGQAVVIVIDEQTLHTLNEVGTFVWSALEGNDRSVGELIDATTTSFEVPHERAAEDVMSFVGELLKLGALERDPS